MYGDYEAQRHWLEITLHLPTSLWYKYDLQYWGLDYPPLTAYHSWLLGFMYAPLWLAGLHSHLRSANKINPEWVALHSSRGIETPSSKVFMRATSLISDLLIYIPSLYFFIRTWLGHRSSRAQQTALLTLLLQPALILIDSGHFQYNSVMVGFTVLALNFFFSGHDLLGAICFVLSLGFKQMALYYSPAVFAYLIGKCLFLGPIRGYVGQRSVGNYADFL
jgi:alpha-1,3-glucosyltransferase